MKKTKVLLFTFLLLLSLMISPVKVNSASKDAIYFKESSCLVCQRVETEGYITKLISQGITVTVFDIKDLSPIDEFEYVDEDGNTVQVAAIDIYTAYNNAYFRFDSGVPVVFAGNTYFEGYTEITEAIDNNMILGLTDSSLLDVDIAGGISYENLTGIIGFFIVLGAGLLDGFNPCAIALLLLFIGLLMNAKDKKILLAVSITYISALFISYYLIGTLALEILDTYRSSILVVGNLVSWFIIIVCLFLFALNVNDYIQSKRENYGKIKHQLPKFIKRFNKRIIKAYANLVNPEEKSRGLIFVLVLTFFLGVILSLTELVCTGGIYFGILLGIHSIQSAYAYILLLFYNIMFVVPLIVIAVLAIRMKSIVTISNWLRERMSTIKLFGAFFFLGTAFFFFIYKIL